jgi:hypothetical protein
MVLMPSPLKPSPVYIAPPRLAQRLPAARNAFVILLLTEAGYPQPVMARKSGPSR